MPAHESESPVGSSEQLEEITFHNHTPSTTDKQHTSTAVPKTQITKDQDVFSVPKSPLGKILLTRSCSSSTSSLSTLERSQTNDSNLSNNNSNENTQLIDKINSHNDYNENNTQSTLINDFFYKTQYFPQTTSMLKPGSKFVGCQQSEKSTYQVEVEFQHVDLSKPYLNGFLTIKGLTETHPEITTFFESEIVSERYSFFTDESNEHTNDIDIQHWSKFANWKNKLPTKKILSKKYIHKDFLKFEDLYMRWKEKFLVPDHKIDNIEGASFAGFYYINFNQVNGNIYGLYYHKSSEQFQQLELRYVEDQGIGSSYQFQ